MAHLGTQTPEQLVELNNHLATNNYVNGDLPGADDVRIFESLKGVPEKAAYTEVHFWYLIISGFAPNIRAQWKESQKKTAQPEKKAEAPKPAQAPKPAEDDVDLFGDDDEEAQAAAKKQAEEKKKKADEEKNKKKKEKPVAKTIVIFDVKVYEAEDVELLERIAAKIRSEIKPEGLVWGQEHKLQEVAFGAKKLTMSMIIEDEKVSSEDVFEIILGWEDDVQSVDVASMQKV